MILLPLASILISSERQRRTFDDESIRDLARDIEANGLIHAVTIKRDSADGIVLLAGERRLRALSLVSKPYRYGQLTVNPGQVPAIDRGELTAIQAEEIELSENLAREALTWAEEYDAMARLHRLRKLQNESQTKSQTVAEILQRSGSPTTTKNLSEALLIADHMSDKEVANAKSAREALSIVVRKLEAAKAEEIAKLVSMKEQKHSLLRGDCREVLKSLDSGVFDVIITDPPYGIDADKHSAASTSASGYSHNYADDEKTAVDIMNAIFVEGFRVSKPKAHLYMFFDLRHWFAILNLAAKAGWTPSLYPIVWNRGGGMIGDYKHIPQRAYDVILYCRKGDREVNMVRPDLVSIPMMDGNLRRHAAEKPVDLYEDLLLRSAKPGNRVLDPCCGAGPIFPAANRLSLYATGIELDPNLGNISLSRFEEK